jgi:hypothetical protein
MKELIKDCFVSKSASRCDFDLTSRTSDSGDHLLRKYFLCWIEVA